MLAKDQGLTTDLSRWLSKTPIFASTPAPGARIPVVVTALEAVANATPGITLEVEYLSTAMTGFFIHESSLSPSPVKRRRGDSSSTLVEEGSSKWVHLLEGVE